MKKMMENGQKPIVDIARMTGRKLKKKTRLRKASFTDSIISEDVNKLRDKILNF